MQLLRRDDAIRFVESNANVLDASGNPRNPFGTSWWFRHFISQVAGANWSLVVPESRGANQGLMLLYRWDSAPVHCAGLTNFYTSLFPPLSSLAVDRERAILAVVEDLDRLRPRVATVNLAPLDAEEPDTQSVARAFRSQGWYVRQYACFGNWYLPCAGLSFEDYFARRDSQLRNTYQRKAKRLLANGSLEIVTRPDEVDLAMDAFDAVYARSWKHAEPYPDFVRGWARVCAQMGWLRLGVARLEGEPIAAQLWFTIDRHAYIFKLAYDQRHARRSAGTVLSAHMFRHALDVDKAVEIDYLSGDDPYKKSWMTHRRGRVGLIACNLRSIRGAFAAGREWAGRLRSEFRSASVHSQD